MIGVVALLVIGPERLPSVARQVGLWVGRARIYVNTVKTDIDRELRMQELQDVMKQDELQGLTDDIKNSINPPATPAPKEPVSEEKKDDVKQTQND